MKSEYDVVILGAGHNGLVAATYLARAGLSVLMLEKNDYVGGATTSQKVFPDYDARLSRYSYLVSLFPEKIIRDLGLNLELRRRVRWRPSRPTAERRAPWLAFEQCLGRSEPPIYAGADWKSIRVRTVEEVLRRLASSPKKFGTPCWSHSWRREDFRRRFE